MEEIKYLKQEKELRNKHNHTYRVWLCNLRAGGNDNITNLQVVYESFTELPYTKHVCTPPSYFVE